MDRLNHVKIVTPDPAAVDRFLREVVDIPEGWPLGTLDAAPPGEVRSPACGADGTFSMDTVGEFRGRRRRSAASSPVRPRVGSSRSSRPTSRRCGASPSARGHLERAHERCVEREIPCTDLQVTPWGDGGTIEFFFADVGGIVFEVMRAG